MRFIGNFFFSLPFPFFFFGEWAFDCSSFSAVLEILRLSLQHIPLLNFGIVS